MKWLVASVKDSGDGGANLFHHTGNSAVRCIDSKCERKEQSCNQYGQRFSAHIANSRSCTLLYLRAFDELRSLRLRRRRMVLWWFSDRFYSAPLYKRNQAAAAVPDTLRVFPGSVGFN